MKENTILKSDGRSFSESIMSVVRPSQYTCTKCLQYFTSRDLLIRHVFSHLSLFLDTPLHICQNCGKIFSNQSQLYDHHFEQTKETTFKQDSLIELTCVFCTDIFLSWCSLTKHVFTHTSAISAPLYVCTYFAEDSEDMTKLHFYKSSSKISQRRYYYPCQCNRPHYKQQIPAIKHGENHKKEEPFSWNCYSKSLKYRYDSEISHSVEPSLVNQKNEKSSKFDYYSEKHQKIESTDPSFYKVRDHAFINHGHLKGHQAINFGEIPISCESRRKSLIQSMHLKSQKRINLYKCPFYCKLCEESFTDCKSIKKYERIHIDERQFSCEVCGKSFANSLNLKIHKYIHFSEHTFSCEYCGKSFTQIGHLKGHMRMHNGERPFTCETCGKSFTLSGHLNRHNLFHLGERPFSCKVCGKSFAESSILKKHKRIHLGGLLFSCDFCGKSFTESWSLKKHKCIHLGEQPFSCDICGKSFTVYGRLQGHIRIHTGEQPFICEVCGKSFTETRYLKRHNMIHLGERPFSCNVCGKSFTESGISEFI